MGQTDNCTVLPYHSLVTQGLSSGLSVSALDGLFFPGTVQLQLVAPELPAHGIYWEKTVHGISTCWARNSFLFLSFKRWFLSKKRILNNFFSICSLRATRGFIGPNDFIISALFFPAWKTLVSLVFVRSHSVLVILVPFEACSHFNSGTELLLMLILYWCIQKLCISIIRSCSFGCVSEKYFDIDFLISCFLLQGADTLQSAIQPEMQIEHGAIQIQ